MKSAEELKREELLRNAKKEVAEDTLSKAAISEKILQEELNQRRVCDCILKLHETIFIQTI